MRKAIRPITLPFKSHLSVGSKHFSCLLRPDGTVAPDRGHVVLIYDERNPAFHNGGKAHAALDKIRKTLRFPNLLRMCSWQMITARIRKEPALQWLGNDLELKYGF